jgi:transposase-like protein
LKERGLKSIGIIVSDGLSGLDKSISKAFSGTPHQKCIVHLQRNLYAMVRREDRKEWVTLKIMGS